MAAYEVGLLIVAIAILEQSFFRDCSNINRSRFRSFTSGSDSACSRSFPVCPSSTRLKTLRDRTAHRALVVIISLMGAGLKIDRPFSLKRWSATWRLLWHRVAPHCRDNGVTCVAVSRPLASHSHIARGRDRPTDPVLASGVEAGAPLTELEEEQDPQYEWGQFGSRSRQKLASTTD